MTNSTAHKPVAATHSTNHGTAVNFGRLRGMLPPVRRLAKREWLLSVIVRILLFKFEIVGQRIDRLLQINWQL